jgi:hypothetical protein
MLIYSITIVLEYNKVKKKTRLLTHTQKQQTKSQGDPNTETNTTFYTLIKTLSNIKFNSEEEKILKVGLNYSFEKPIKQFLQDLIIDTENAIKQLHENEQNIYRFLACNKIKQIQNITSTNALHKRQNYVIKQT